MRGDRRFASSSPVALIVLYLFPLFTFYNPPNSGHLNNLYYVQIILAYFFLGSFESNMSLFMYRVYPVTDEHSSCCSQRSTALLFSFAVKSSPRRTCACRKNRASPGGNRRQWSGFCRRSGPWCRVRDLHYHLFSPFFFVCAFIYLSPLCSTILKFKMFFLLVNIASTNFFFSPFDVCFLCERYAFYARIFQLSHLSSWDFLLSFSTIPPYNYFYFVYLFFVLSCYVRSVCVITESCQRGNGTPVRVRVVVVSVGEGR